MIALFRAELLKARTVRFGWWWTFFGALAGAALTAVSMVGAASDDVLVGTAADIESALAYGLLGIAVTAAFGAQLATVEFRFGTATGTFLGAPHRNRVVIAKLLAAAVLSLPIGLIFAAVSFAGGLPWLLASGADLAAHLPLIVGRLAAQAGAAVAFGALGAGLGLLVRNHLGGVLLAIIGPFALAAVVELVSGPVARFLPFGAAAALAGESVLLPLWGAVLVLLGWIGLVGVGGALATRRDIA